MVTNIIL